MSRTYIALIALIVALVGTILVMATFYIALQLFRPASTQIVFPTPTGSHISWVCDMTYDPNPNDSPTYHWGTSHPSYPDSYCPPWPVMATP